MGTVNPEAVIRFGIHRGKTLNEIPSDYLEWLIRQDWFEDKYPDLLESTEGELDWRDQFGRHF
jgi:uncharacterized protein (DUF3820 family)